MMRDAGVSTVHVVRDIADDDLRTLLADACSSAAGADFESVVTVADRLRQVAQGEDDPIRALIAALEYHLVIDPGQRGDSSAFGPMIEANGKAYPAPVSRINDIDAGILPLWERAEGSAPLSLVAARFADLLWEARFGDRPYLWARRAVDHYLSAAVSVFGSPIEISESLRRALEVATEVNDADRVAAVLRALVDLARSAIDCAENLPGVALPILELLAGRKRDAPLDLAHLIDDAVARYRADPWNFEAALNIKARLSAADDRGALREAQVAAFSDLARRSEGLVKYAHFQHAIELATEHGLRSEAEALRREVEELPQDALELKTISAEVELPRDALERFIHGVVGDDDLPSALARFGSHVPTGLPEDNASFVRELMREHPLQFLFTKMVLGPDNSLIKAVQTPEDHEEHALLEHELHRIQVFSVFALDMLARMRARYGDLSDHASWFESELIAPDVAQAIHRALRLFEGGDYDSSASVLVPRLERIVREIARACGLTITRSPDRAGRPGGVKPLGELLSALQSHLDEATRRYLRALLSEITGLNIRNRISHGLVDAVSDREAAMLIHAACHLRLLSARGPVSHS